MKKSLLPAVLAFSSLALAKTAAAQTPVFVQFPMTVNDQDNVAVRSAGITVATPSFRRLTVSNGLVPPGTPPPTAYPAYSAAGQAIGFQPNGGGWSSNAMPPGPGSNPARTIYENFAITAIVPARADSVIFTAPVAASANGRVAVTYSLSNYARDSASVSGGKGPTGVLPATANGSFGVAPTTMTAGARAYNQAVLLQYDATVPNASTFRLALNGANGVALAANQTLTVRLHFAVSSGSAGRYVLLRNVIIKSRQGLATRSAVNTNLAVYPSPAQNQVVVPHAAIGHDARIAVYNAVGAQVGTMVAKAGTSQTTVRLDALSAGLYLVEYSNGQERSSARVVKE